MLPRLRDFPVGSAPLASPAPGASSSAAHAPGTPAPGTPAPGAPAAGAPAPLPPVRVLLVDDSAMMRGAVSRMLAADPELAVVGTASNGQQALEALARQAADMVVLDVEMPVMDGLTALPLILKQYPATRVLMLSAHGGRGAEVTVRALALGAADFVCKPGTGGAPATPGAPGSRAAALEEHAAELRRKIRTIGRSAQRMAARAGGRPAAPAGAAPAAPSTSTPFRPPLGGAPAATPNAAHVTAHAAAPAAAPARPAAGGAMPRPRAVDVLAVASSTGGPAALTEFLGALKPAPTVPVVITQHMPAEFTRPLAARLATATGLPCAEAQDGEVLRPGHVYIAPGGYHLIPERHGAEVRVRLTQDPPVNHCRPAADPMFAAVSAAYGANVLAVVLTGMGHDGRDGAAAVARRGGRVLAQDEATSVVWGMPGAVAQAGLAEAVQPIAQLAAHAVACYAARATGRA